MQNYEMFSWLLNALCELVDDRLFWKGTITGDINIVGENCLPIKPSVDLEPPAGMTKYYFNMGLLRDISVHLQLTTPAPSASSSSTTGVVNKRCFKCGKTVPLSIAMPCCQTHSDRRIGGIKDVWILWQGYLYHHSEGDVKEG